MKVLLLLVVAIFVNCDLPVHCLWNQTQGTWTFSYSEQNLGPEAVNICNASSPLPNKMRIELKSPNIAIDLDSGMVGTFTLIYDQGFEVIINGLKFFTFFFYTDDKDEVVSHCGQTFVGTYHDAVPRAQHWGCYQATKETNRGENMIHRYPKSWLKKLSQQPMEMGRPVLAFRQAAHAEHTRTFSKPAKPDISQLPESYDWRNVDGKNYVNPVRNQAQCGSCFSFASTGSLSSRVWIQTGLAEQPVFSPQKVLDCSKYSQGCMGGFAYLTAGKYAEDFGFVSEDCYPYKAQTDKCMEGVCKHKTYAGYYHYVGGYYGGCTMEGMMKEVYEHGPIPVAFKVTAVFKKYAGGVFICEEDNIGTGSSSNGTEPPPPWFIVTNHAVQVVGWGVDNNVPYWIVKNSWGDWGPLGGYFWIRRGLDDCGIESAGFASTPLVFPNP